MNLRILLAAVAAALPLVAQASARCTADAADAGARQRPLAVVGLAEPAGAQALVCFGERSAGKARTLVPLSGLQTDTRLVGIDYRVQDGRLYGVGNAGGLYQLDVASGAATPVGRLSVALDPAATAFGVDFNPAANALRIVSSSGQNLRQPFGNLGTGTPLAATVADAPLSAMGVAGAAYTNNDADAVSGTTLFDLSAASDQVLLQSPPNNGSLVATGGLGVDAAAVAGFDIHTTLKDGAPAANRALAVLKTADGRAGLYEVDLLGGRAAWLGDTDPAWNLADIAIPIAP